MAATSHSSAAAETNDWFTARVESIADAGRVRRIVFSTQPSSPSSSSSSSPASSFSFGAGQWVDLDASRHDPALPLGGYSMVSGDRRVAASTGRTAAALLRAVRAPSLPRFELAIQRTAHPTVQFLHSARLTPGLEVAVRVGGEFHRPLDALLADAGDAGQRPPPRCLVFIAGGVGITPLYSMILTAAAAIADGSVARGTSIVVCHSARTVVDLAFAAEMRALAANLGAGRMRLHFTLTGAEAAAAAPDGLAEYWAASAEADTEAGAADGNLSFAIGGAAHTLHIGRLTRERIGAAIADGERCVDAAIQIERENDKADSETAGCSSTNDPPGDTAARAPTHVFVCGPPSMTDAVVRDLLEGSDGRAGRPKETVHFEKWW